MGFPRPQQQHLPQCKPAWNSILTTPRPPFNSRIKFLFYPAAAPNSCCSSRSGGSSLSPLDKRRGDAAENPKQLDLPLFPATICVPEIRNPHVSSPIPSFSTVKSQFLLLLPPLLFRPHACMASGPLVGDSGGGGGGGDGSRQKHKWSDSKVYTRKVFRKPLNPNPNPLLPPPPSPPETTESTATTSSTAVISGCNDQKPHTEILASPVSNNGGDTDEKDGNKNDGDDNGNSQASPRGGTGHPQSNGHGPFVSHRIEGDGQHMFVVNLACGSRDEAMELCTQLQEELDRVRASYRRIEALELKLLRPPVPIEPPIEHPAPVEMQPISMETPTDCPGPTENHVQYSAFDSRILPNHGVSNSGPLLHRHLNVQVESHSMSDVTEKEKRTPKANKYYKNEDFLLVKDKFPPQDSHKKSKTNGKKDNGTAVLGKIYMHAFKRCSALLAKLMKHRHGWVFKSPVDVKGLGLHDYYIIIKHPMDLGTIKSRLSTNWYKTPREFAEDVRLTFSNAMTYNPKGQDVHIMAEQLLNVFEERWPAIEAEFTMPSYAMLSKKAPPPLPDLRRILERSESMTYPALPNSTSKTSSYTPHIVRTPSSKKPKAKDLHKREMTFEEKQKLSNNLQNLPSEKLDIVVQIIRKRNSALSQHDNEIEVDIDSVDIETLWELDRFVTNYKKSLSKLKRKAELAMTRQIAVKKMREQYSQVTVPPGNDMQMERRTDRDRVASSPNGGDQTRDSDRRSSSSSSSRSSDSGSSSSDSDSESSSD